MAIPLGNLNGLSSQLDSIAGLMKNVVPGVMGATAVSPPKQFPGIEPMGSTTDFGAPPKQLPQFGGDQTGYDPYGLPSKQFPGQLGDTFSAPTQSQFGLPSGPGQVGSLGGEFGVLDQFNNAFQQAGAKYGIDANWLKSIAATERGWEGNSISGAIGLMQIMPGGYANLEAQYPNWRSDPAQNIMLGAAILNAKRQEQGGDLNRGTMGYLGFGTDAYGTTPDQYLASVNKYYGQLQGSGGNFGGASGGGLTSAFGSFGAAVPDWGEFNVPSDNGLYGYGAEYGLNGTNHTGIDVPMPYGTAYRAPSSGTVMCAGTGIGQSADGSGCAAFSDMIGGGAGRVEVLLDNGAVLIFGHSSSSALRPGQHFNAGDVLGASGGENSNHVHLEARVRDSSTQSGWRIVDPRSVLGGGGATGGYAGQGDTRGYGSIASQIHSFLSGRR